MARPIPKLIITDIPGTLREIIRAIADLFNNNGTVTLTANATSTTLTHHRINPDSNIILTPTTSNAKDEKPYISESGRVNGSVVITHSNNAQTDRTYRYSVIG